MKIFNISETVNLSIDIIDKLNNFEAKAGTLCEIEFIYENECLCKFIHSTRGAFRYKIKNKFIERN